MLKNTHIWLAAQKSCRRQFTKKHRGLNAAQKSCSCFPPRMHGYIITHQGWLADLRNVNAEKHTGLNAAQKSCRRVEAGWLTCKRQYEKTHRTKRCPKILQQLPASKRTKAGWQTCETLIRKNAQDETLSKKSCSSFPRRNAPMRSGRPAKRQYEKTHRTKRCPKIVQDERCFEFCIQQRELTVEHDSRFGKQKFSFFVSEKIVLATNRIEKSISKVT